MMQNPPGVLLAAGGLAQAVPPLRLVRAAHEFEAQMLKELLKPMVTPDELAEKEDEDGSGSNGALSQFASETLGRSLSEHGGLGIANTILSNLFKTGSLSKF